MLEVFRFVLVPLRSARDLVSPRSGLPTLLEHAHVQWDAHAA